MSIPPSRMVKASPNDRQIEGETEPKKSLLYNLKSAKVKLRTALIVPFVLQISLTGGILVLLSLWQGQKNVNILSYKLLYEINYRITQEINAYLDIPRSVQRVNVQAIEAGLLKPENLKRSAQIFWHQASTFNFVNIGYGTQIPNLGLGEYVSAGYSYGQPDISILSRANPHHWDSFVPDELGHPRSISPIPDQDPDAQNVFQEAWYKDAIHADRTVWSHVYTWESEPSQISIDLTTPIHCKNILKTDPNYCQSPNQVRGVLAISVSLQKLSDFLSNLRIGETDIGRAFIIDRWGNLVAQSIPYSTGKKLKKDHRQAVQIQAKESDDSLIAAAGQYLDPYLEHYGETHQLELSNKVYELDPPKHDRLFILARPYTSQDLECISPNDSSQNSLDNSPVNVAQSVNQTLKKPLGKTLEEKNILTILHQITCASPQDWIIVTVIPGSDFLTQVEVTNRNTIVVSCISLAIVLGVGIFTSRWINDGILCLTQAAQLYGQGHLDHKIVLDQPIQVTEVETLGETFNKMAQELSQSFDHINQQRQSFARFFPAEFFCFLEKSDIREIELGNYVTRDMSILFSDIRSFTNLSEQMTPQENFEFLNAYLGQVSPEIRRCQGFVVKFIGDGLMAVFPTGADAAIAAGIAQFQRLEQFNQTLKTKNHPLIAVGMGIHTGQVMLGMLGETDRLQGDTISSHVNFAARLEGLTKYFGASLLISETTYNQLQHPDRYTIQFLGKVQVKGSKQPMGVYEVLDACLDEKLRETKENHYLKLQEMIQQFSRGNTQEAWTILEHLISQNPDDLILQLYDQEVKRWQYITGGWDGVIVFDRK